MAKRRADPTSLQFFSRLVWLDGTPLLDHIEPYRREIFAKVFDTFAARGHPLYSLVLAGRGKKNWKSADLVLGALYALVIRRSPLGNSGIIVASDENQAADDLSLAKKLVAVNPDLGAEIDVLAKELRLCDGSGSLKIIPGRDVAGAHGKTYNFLGIDELHTAKDWAMLEALAPDPHRADALQWITSYASLYNVVGAPLADLIRIAKAGTDKRMLFSWYSGEFCTDPAFADRPPLERANPSMASWVDGAGYLEQQRLRLPTGRFRRLHLNLPGAPEGAAFDQAAILKCVVTGRRTVSYEAGRHYTAAADMSGGSSDDAVLAIAHLDGRNVVLDRIVRQLKEPPFDPRHAVAFFCQILADYQISKVYGDAFAGQTFRKDFAARGIGYEVRSAAASLLYEKLEPVLNAGEIELLDQPTLVEQLVSLVWRGQKIDHEPGGHDDWANAAALACAVAREAITRDRVPMVPLPDLSRSGLAASAPNLRGVPQHYLANHSNQPWRAYVEGGCLPRIAGKYWGPIGQ